MIMANYLLTFGYGINICIEIKAVDEEPRNTDSFESQKFLVEDRKRCGSIDDFHFGFEI